MVQTIKESVKFWLVRWCMPLFVPFCLTHFSVWQVLFGGSTGSRRWVRWSLTSSLRTPLTVKTAKSEGFQWEQVHPYTFLQISKILQYFSHLSKQYFYSSHQPGPRLSRLQKILNSFAQSGESFLNPLKEYFLPSASQGRKTFHTSKKY